MGIASAVSIREKSRSRGLFPVRIEGQEQVVQIKANFHTTTKISTMKYAGYSNMIHSLKVTYQVAILTEENINLISMSVFDELGPDRVFTLFMV